MAKANPLDRIIAAEQALNASDTVRAERDPLLDHLSYLSYKYAKQSDKARERAVMAIIEAKAARQMAKLVEHLGRHTMNDIASTVDDAINGIHPDNE